MKVNSLYKLLISSYGLSVFSEGVLLPIYAIFVQKIGGDILDASGAVATFFITQGVLTIMIHRVKWNSKHKMKLLIGGWAVWVLGITSYLFVSNVFTLFLTQILIALGNGIADPVFDGELAGHTDSSSREFEWGFFEGSKWIFEGLAAIVGGLIAAIFGFYALILTMVAAASLSLLFIVVYSKEQSKFSIKKLFIWQ